MDREDDNMPLTKKGPKEEFSLVARFLTSRALNINAVARTFSPLWRSQNGFQIRNLGDHKLLFIFDNKPDVERILQNEPWSFDKHLVVFQRYNKNTVSEDYALNEATFWVQVHNIPLGYMDTDTAEEICSKIGKVVKSTGKKDYGGEGFIRVRVIVDVTQPLCRGRVVTLENGKRIWISFRYERLPNLCYWCGRLDHDDKDCEVWVHSEGSLDASKKNYDSSIRAKPVYQSSKNVVHVPGFFEGRKKDHGKASPMSSSKSPATREIPSPHPPVTESPESGSEKQGIPINADVTTPLTRRDCNPVNISVQLSEDNGKEEFADLNPGIDTEKSSDVIATHKNLNSHATSSNPSSNGPNLIPSVSTCKPTKWTRINRPITPQDTISLCDLLGKRSSTSSTHDQPVQKRRAQDASFDSDNDYPTARAVTQPRREP